MTIKISFFMIVTIHSFGLFGNDEQTTLIHKKDNTSCLYTATLFMCPLVLGLGGSVAGITCFWANPHACVNFPIPKAEHDWDAFLGNMFLSPLILGAGGAVTGCMLDGAIVGCRALIRYCREQPQSQDHNVV